MKIVVLQDGATKERMARSSGHHIQESHPEETADQKCTHWTLNKWKINQILELLVQQRMLTGPINSSSCLHVSQQTHHYSETGQMNLEQTHESAVI